MSYATMPIVGAFYRPPAKTICDALAVGTRLFLCAEPDNPADVNAVAVWIASADIPPSAHEKLEADLPRFGFTLDLLLEQEQWQLGYVPKELAAQLRAENIVSEQEIVWVTFSVQGNGKPQVTFPEPVL